MGLSELTISASAPTFVRLQSDGLFTHVEEDIPAVAAARKRFRPTQNFLHHEASQPEGQVSAPQTGCSSDFLRMFLMRSEADQSDR